MHSMTKIFVYAILLLVSLALAACSSDITIDSLPPTEEVDAPAEAAKEWYEAVNTMEALAADSLVCEAQREAFRREMEAGSLFFTSAESLLASDQDIELDISDVEFRTMNQERDTATVRARGEVRAAVGSSIYSEAISERWEMVEEDGEWKWCEDVVAETAETPPTPAAKPTEVDEPEAAPVGNSTATEVPTDPSEPPTLVSIHLPGDGLTNGNGYIGPFCCTGETAIISANGTPVGYIYYYGWQGEAYNVADGSVATDIEILVSGLSNLANPSSEQIQSSVSFLAEELVPGATKSTQAGELIFSVAVEDAELEEFNDELHYRMGSAEVIVNISTTAPGQWELVKNEPQHDFFIVELEQSEPEGGWTEYTARLAYLNRSDTKLPEFRGGRAYVITDSGDSYDASVYEDAIGSDLGTTFSLYAGAPLLPGLAVRQKYSDARDSIVLPTLSFRIPSSMHPISITIDESRNQFFVLEELEYPLFDDEPGTTIDLPAEYKVRDMLTVRLSPPVISGERISIPVQAESLNATGDEALSLSHYAVDANGLLLPGGHGLGDCGDAWTDVGIEENHPLTIGPLQTVESEICIRMPLSPLDQTIAVAVYGDIEGVFLARVGPASETSQPSSPQLDESSQPGRILVLSDMDGNNETFDDEVFVVDSDGTNLRNLSNHEFADFAADLSPDGSKVIFATLRTGDSQIWLADIEASSLRQLVAEPLGPGTSASWPIWSPEGDEVAFTLMGDVERNGIYLVDSSGGDIYPFTSDPSVPPFIYEPFGWSPDGERIFVIDSPDGGGQDWEIAVIHRDGTKQYLSNDPSGEGKFGSMSPDGERVAFVHWPTYTIWTVSNEGQDLAELTDLPSMAPNWSPSGDRLAFYSIDGSTSDIFIIDADGSNLQNVTNHPARDHSPVWSPDGTEIAFASDRDGNFEIYVINLDTGDVRRLTYTDGADETPLEWVEIAGP